MKIVPLNDESWRVYYSWFEAHNTPPPLAMPKQAIMVATEEGELLGGICVYLTDGPFMFLEHMQLKPGLSVGQIRQVIRQGLEVAKGMGSILRKIPMVHEQREAIAYFLDQAGYIQTPGTVWYGIPGTSSKEPPKPAPAPKRKKSKTRAAECISCGASFITKTNEELCPECTPAEDLPPSKPKKKRAAGRRKKNADAVDKGSPAGDE